MRVPLFPVLVTKVKKRDFQLEEKSIISGARTY